MTNYEKQVEQEAAYHIPISFYNCFSFLLSPKKSTASDAFGICFWCSMVGNWPFSIAGVFSVPWFTQPLLTISLVCVPSFHFDGKTLPPAWSVVSLPSSIELVSPSSTFVKECLSKSVSSSMTHVGTINLVLLETIIRWRRECCVGILHNPRCWCGRHPCSSLQMSAAVLHRACPASPLSSPSVAPRCRAHRLGSRESIR